MFCAFLCLLKMTCLSKFRLSFSTSPVGVQDDVTEELDLDDPDIDFEDEEDLNDEED